MLTFTLDTNCVIAIDEGRPQAASVRTLANSHLAGKANVAVMAISASENQQDGRHIKGFAQFEERMAALGLAHLDILKPIGHFDITFYDWCRYSDDAMIELERKIHAILFPNVEFSWQDYCAANGLNPASTPTGRWRNCKCDVQAIWTHIDGQRDVFVTSDQKFHGPAKKAALIRLGARHIEHPAGAVSLL